MNANELADELANVGWNKPFLNWELLDETAAMLRQQQAEIKTLKLQNDNYWVMIEILRQKVKAQKKC